MVDLPLPVLPTMAVVWPGRAWNEMPFQDRYLRARVAEADVAELDHAAGRGVEDHHGPLRVMDGRLGVQDLVDASG